MIKLDKNLNNYSVSNKNIYRLEIIWIIFLFVIQISMVPYPGTDHVNPQGFFGWYDQGQYLNILNDFICCGLKNSKEWPYPFGYILFSVPFNALISNTQVSIVVANLTLLILSYYIIRNHIKNNTKAILLISFIILSYYYDLIRYAFFIPWSTSATLIAFAICVNMHLREKRDFSYIVILGITNSFMFFCRPQDAILLFIFNSLSITMLDKQKNIIRNLFIFVLITFIPLLLSKLFYGSFLIGGSIYTSTQHAFLPFGVIHKLIALFNGDVGYGIDSISVFNYSPVLYFGLLFLILYGIISLPIYYTVSLVFYFGIYLSFSDFGPHNLVVFQLFHYLKLPLLIIFVLFIDKFTIVEYKKYLFIVLIVCIFSFLAISYKNNLANCRNNLSNGNVISACSNNDKSDVVYIKGFIKKFPNVYFDESELIINGSRLLLYKDYRVFSAPQGLILYIFEGRVIDDLKFNTINYSLKDDLHVIYYKRFGVLEW
jgi:hypothetical protein